MAKTIYIDNGMLVKLDGLIDLSNSTYNTSATVQAILKTTSGTSVAGQSWPLTLTHQSSGNYQGTLTSSLDLSGVNYKLEVTVNSGDDSAAFFDIDARAKRRKN